MKYYRKNIIALTVAFALGGIATGAAAAADRIIPANRPVIANNGEVEYKITLDPLYASTLEIPAKLKGFIRHALTESDFYIGNEELEEPTIRYLAYTLADVIHKKPKKILSWAGTEFYSISTSKTSSFPRRRESRDASLIRCACSVADGFPPARE